MESNWKGSWLDPVHFFLLGWYWVANPAVKIVIIPGQLGVFAHFKGYVFRVLKNEGKRVKTVVEKWHLWVEGMGPGLPVRPLPGLDPKERRRGAKAVRGLQGWPRPTFWCLINLNRFKFKRRCRTWSFGSPFRVGIACSSSCTCWGRIQKRA